MNLNLIIIIPLLTSIAVLFCKGLKQVRMILLIGAAIQLILSFVLLYAYWQERVAGNTSTFIFEYNVAWYAPLHINYHIGIDGISMAMILLTSFIVLTGVLVSWKMPARPPEEKC